jgi:hypothetical protein
LNAAIIQDLEAELVDALLKPFFNHGIELSVAMSSPAHRYSTWDLLTVNRKGYGGGCCTGLGMVFGGTGSVVSEE